MTTIAFKDGVLAADSQEIYGDLALEFARKIEPVDAESVFVAVGDSTHGKIFLKWLKNNFEGERPHFTDDDRLNGVQFFINGEIREYYWCSDVPIIKHANRLRHGCMAYGTGREIAMGAMLAGASAIDAVFLACRVDCNSHPPVTYASLSNGLIISTVQEPTT